MSHILCEVEVVPMLFCYVFPQPLHHLLCAAPGHGHRLELSGHGLVCLDDEAVHGEVSARENYVARAQREGRAEVVGAITDIENSLVRSAALLRSAGNVVAHEHLFAHVDRTPGAVM